MRAPRILEYTILGTASVDHLEIPGPTEPTVYIFRTNADTTAQRILGYRVISKLSTIPGTVTSLSHTRGLVAIYAYTRGVRLGIDVELKTRKIPSASRAKIHKMDSIDTSSIEPIQTWVLKEAAYKVLYPKLHADIWVDDLSLSFWQPSSYDAVVVHYDASVLAKIIETSQYWIGISSATN